MISSRAEQQTVHQADETSPLRRSAAARYMFEGAAATEMMRQAANERKVAQHRHSQLEAREKLLSLLQAQGTIRRFAHDPAMARLAADGALPSLGKGYTDSAIFRALPSAKQREVLRHMRTPATVTPLDELKRPKRVVDRSTLKSGKDKTSFFQ